MVVTSLSWPLDNAQVRQDEKREGSRREAGEGGREKRREQLINTFFLFYVSFRCIQMLDSQVPCGAVGGVRHGVHGEVHGRATKCSLR